MPAIALQQNEANGASSVLRNTAEVAIAVPSGILGVMRFWRWILFIWVLMATNHTSLPSVAAPLPTYQIHNTTAKTHHPVAISHHEPTVPEGILENRESVSVITACKVSRPDGRIDGGDTGTFILSPSPREQPNRAVIPLRYQLSPDVSFCHRLGTSPVAPRAPPFL